MKAILPDQECRAPIQAGALTRGTLPYMTRAEPSWMIANMVATVASQDFTAPGLENPARLSAMPVGPCSRPYTPSASATSPPISAGTTSRAVPDLAGADGGAGVAGCAVIGVLHSSRCQPPPPPCLPLRCSVLGTPVGAG